MWLMWMLMASIIKNKNNPWIVIFLLALIVLLYKPWTNWWKVSKNDFEKTVAIDMGGTELRALADLYRPTEQEIEDDRDRRGRRADATPEEIAQRTQDIRYHFCQRRPR